MTLPTDVTVDGSTNPCRSVLFGDGGSHSNIIVVNGLTKDIYIDEFGTARLLQLIPPTGMPTVAAGAGTGLTGVYRAAVTFKIKDASGRTISESGLGPVSAASASLSNTTILVTAIPVSSDGNVNARGLYRSLAGGTVLYPWFDIDDNVTLSDDRGVADALLSLLPTSADRLGSPPDLKLISSWRDRLWGTPRLLPDYLLWTDERRFDGWSADNSIVVPPQNTDTYGVTAHIPRRDNLGLVRRKKLDMISGSGNDSFQRVGISETLGCVSQESVIVRHNVAYMLGELGVNKWSDDGMVCVSDAQVGAWFQTDLYFNRSQFPIAKGRYNVDTDAYELFLCSLGSEVIDRWVSYHLKSRTWYGPHVTDATMPTSVGSTSTLGGTLNDVDNMPLTIMGGADGYLYKRDSTVVTDAGMAVPMSMTIAPLSAGQPDLLKYFDRGTIHTRAETTGSLSIVPTVGSLEDAAGATMTHDLTMGRETLDRFGEGRYLQLTITHSNVVERPRIYGIEIPYHVTARR